MRKGPSLTKERPHNPRDNQSDTRSPIKWVLSNYFERSKSSANLSFFLIMYYQLLWTILGWAQAIFDGSAIAKSSTFYTAPASSFSAWWISHWLTRGPGRQWPLVTEEAGLGASSTLPIRAFWTLFAWRGCPQQSSVPFLNSTFHTFILW